MIDTVDSLALLAHKCAPNVFDLSSGMMQVSIRDQIVRAQLLVRDLHKADPSLSQMLVVGAGVAGIAAAVAAADLGVNVVVAESAQRPFTLFRNVHGRHVGPFMYDWPSCIHAAQDYPPSGPQWGPEHSGSPAWLAAQPISAHQLYFKLCMWARTAIRQRPVFLRTGVDRAAMTDFVQRFAVTEGLRARRWSSSVKPPPKESLIMPSAWRPWPRGDYGAQLAITPDYVLLAGGMGAEDTNLCRGKTAFKGPAFWGEDTLREPATSTQQVGIFGGGDGGLQDALRAMTIHDHPLQTIQAMERAPAVREALASVHQRLLAMEQQSCLFTSWTAGGSAYRQVDTACRQLALELAGNPAIRKQLRLALRPGTGVVRHYVRESHFGKAYLLNRFLVHLLVAAQQRARRWAGCMRYELHFNHSASGGSMTPGAVMPYTVQVEGKTEQFHVVAVRYGVEPGSVPGRQIIQMSAKPSRQRTTLAHLPLPFMLNGPK